MILETMILMGMNAKAFTIAKKVSDALCNSRWMSTQETAYSLLSMAKFFKVNGKSKDLNYSYSVNGSTFETVNSPRIITQNTIKTGESTGKGKAKIKNEGKGTIYARIITSGIPEVGIRTKLQVILF